MEIGELHKCLEMSKRAALYFLKRFPKFRSMREDLQQVAILAILRAETTYDTAKNPNRYAYYWKAACISVHDHLWHQQWWPLKAPENFSTPIPKYLDIESHNEPSWPDFSCQQNEWVEKVATILHQRFGDELEAEIALDSILGDDSVESIALKHRVPHKCVYQITERAKIKLRQSSLKHLLK